MPRRHPSDLLPLLLQRLRTTSRFGAMTGMRRRTRVGIAIQTIRHGGVTTPAGPICRHVIPSTLNVRAGGGGGGGDLPHHGSNRRGCNDDRDNIIGEYIARPVIGWVPQCNSFSNSGGSTHFSWSEFNGGFSNGNPHNPWGIFGAASSLEDTRTAYNRGGISLSSGYRCPKGNDSVGGVPTSRHMFGWAADMYSADHTWTEQEFNLLSDAASSTSPTELLTWNYYSNHHLHAAWN